MTAHVTIQEHGPQEALNSPGGDELFKKLGGGSGGIPFFAFLNEQGDMIVNSIAPGKLEAGNGGYKGGNIGHPDKPEEVDWFMVMLSKGAPGMTAEERGTIEHWLRNQKK